MSENFPIISADLARKIASTDHAAAEYSHCATKTPWTYEELSKILWSKIRENAVRGYFKLIFRVMFRFHEQGNDIRQIVQDLTEQGYQVEVDNDNETLNISW